MSRGWLCSAHLIPVSLSANWPNPLGLVRIAMIRLDHATQTPLDRFLARLPSACRTRTHTLLTNPRCGGHGLRAWYAMAELDGRRQSDTIPTELVEVYLKDDQAEPLHDCETCGTPMPVRASRRCGHEATVEHVYFPACPCCGGKTGRYAYWSRTT